MTIKSLLLVAVTCFILTACESTPNSTKNPFLRASCMVKEEGRYIPCKDAKNKEDPNRLICTNELMHGSRFTERVCLTAATRKKRAEEHKNSVHKMQAIR